MNRKSRNENPYILTGFFLMKKFSENRLNNLLFG